MMNLHLGKYKKHWKLTFSFFLCFYKVGTIGVMMTRIKTGFETY